MMSSALLMMARRLHAYTRKDVDSTAARRCITVPHSLRVAAAYPQQRRLGLSLMR